MGSVALSAHILLHHYWMWIVASGIVFIAGYVRATIGFGSGLIMVGLLTLFFPVKSVVPMVLLLDIVGSIILGGYDFHHIQWKELGWLMPGSILGLAIGAWILKSTPAQHLTFFLGVFLLLYVLYAVWVKVEKLPRARLQWGIILGFLGGVIGSLYGGGGPPLVAFMQMRKLDKRRFRATFQGIALIDNVIRIAMYIGLALLTLPLTLVFIMLTPAMILGLWFGNKLHLAISEKAFMRGTLLLLFAIAVKYLVGGLG